MKRDVANYGLIGWIFLLCLLLSVLPVILLRRSVGAEGFSEPSAVLPAPTTEVLQKWLQTVNEQRKNIGDGRSEVFQVGPDKFTYDSAQERCRRYGGRLAHFEELLDAQRRGAHWCRKGWIADGRVAQIKGSGDDANCPEGDPGVYAETYPSAVRFAATCYAPRPKPGVHWQQEVERRRKAMEAERARREAEASVRFVATLRQQMEEDRRHREDMMHDEVLPFNGQALVWSQS